MMPSLRKDFTTASTSFSSRTKSPVAATPLGDGWKLMAVAMPIAGGRVWWCMLIADERGKANASTLPFTVPALPIACSISFWFANGWLAAGAAGGAVGVFVTASAVFKLWLREL